MDSKTEHNGHSKDGTRTSKTKTRAFDLFSYGRYQADRIVSPATRQRAFDSAWSFASKRPLLSLFIAAQLFTSLFPLLLFTTFVVSALVVALLSCIAFVLFWTGVALLFLVPTLFFTCGLAIIFWLWAVGSYVIVRTAYSKLPASIRGTDKNTETQVIFNGDSSAPHSMNRFDKAVDAEVAEVKH